MNGIVEFDGLFNNLFQSYDLFNFPLPGWYAACEAGKESYRSLLTRDAIMLMKTFYMWLSV